ncbi:hypothetical protein RUND412_000661 [Rhizina undulata]
MAPSQKCYVSVGKNPEKTVLQHPFNSQVDFLLPTSLYELLSHDLSSTFQKPLSYHRLTAPLSAILEKDFFTKYIKLGNILLLSKGRIDIDNIISLSSGTLRLSLTREAYERLGLTGKPARYGNTTSKRPSRYLVTLDLRDPYMLHGKPGFNRILTSIKTLPPFAFLFLDLSQPETPCPLLTALSATAHEIHPQILSTAPLLIPTLQPPNAVITSENTLEPEFEKELWEEWVLHVYEWLALASFPADRIKEGDKVDPLLSVYSVDTEGAGVGVTRMRFRGIISAEWIWKLWDSINELVSKLENGDGNEENCWFSMTVHGFENTPISWEGSEHGSLTGGENGYTLLKRPGEGKKWVVFELVGSQDQYS